MIVLQLLDWFPPQSSMRLFWVRNLGLFTDIIYRYALCAWKDVALVLPTPCTLATESCNNALICFFFNLYDVSIVDGECPCWFLLYLFSRSSCNWSNQQDLKHNCLWGTVCRSPSTSGFVSVCAAASGGAKEAIGTSNEAREIHSDHRKITEKSNPIEFCAKIPRGKLNLPYFFVGFLRGVTIQLPR